MYVTVHFFGICTHLNNIPGFTRVVLVDAGFGANIAEHAIPPHTATLYIPHQFIASAPSTIDGLTSVPRDELNPSKKWTMSGVQLQLSNATGELTKTPDYRLLPSLKLMAKSASVAGVEIEVDRRVVTDGAAACAFQITAGLLDAYQEPTSTAVAGKLTIQTDAPPQLIVTRIWDGSIATIALQRADGRDPVIYVSNIGDDPDTVADFMLHYGVTTFTPDRVLVPLTSLVRAANAEELGTLALFPPPAGMTIGCSNSNYP